MIQVMKGLAVVLADTYTLYLKTQNYHWHVKGVQFKSLHLLFEEQYQALAEAVDALAERMVMRGHTAPATFKAFNELRTIDEGDASLTANQMLIDLVNDHTTLLAALQKALLCAAEQKDEGSIALLSERIAAHEKMRWMLSASKEDEE